MMRLLLMRTCDTERVGDNVFVGVAVVRYGPGEG